MKQETIILFGKKCQLEFGQYPNKTITITAIYQGHPHWTCTVNWQDNWQGCTPYKKTFAFPYVVIKGYDENEGMVKQLEKAGVIKPGAYMAGTGGTVQTASLTEKWQKIAKKELEAIPAKG